MFGNVFPTVLSLNAGAPFQPVNRSPQVRIKQNITNTLSFTCAALYEMQYLSQGPLGSSASYMKNALIPDIFAGFESKTKHWTSGIGFDTKTIQPDRETITSVSGSVYSQYLNNGFQVKGKIVWGQNLSDMIIPGVS